MRLLITGGNGFLGGKIIQFPRREERVLRILLKNGEIPQENKHRDEYVYGDLLDEKSLYEATREVDIVIHLAAVTHTNKIGLYYCVNVEGTRKLLEACKKNKVKRIVHVSSRTASLEGGDYAKSKLLSEELVKKSGLDWLILRLAEVYGLGGRGGLNQLIDWVKRFYLVPVIGSGDYTLCPVSLDDAAWAVASSAEADVHKEILTIAGPEVFTYNELIDKIAAQLGVKRIKIHLPLILVSALAKFTQMLKLDVVVRDQISRLLCEKPTNISLAIKLLNYHPKNFKEGLRKYLQESS